MEVILSVYLTAVEAMQCCTSELCLEAQLIELRGQGRKINRLITILPMMLATYVSEIIWKHKPVIARTVDHWNVNLGPCSNFPEMFESWRCCITGDLLESDHPCTLESDITRFDGPENTLPKVWCSLQRELSQCDPTNDKYKVMIMLSFLSYTQKYSMELLRGILAFATVRGLADIRAPPFATFDLSDGYELDRSVLRTIIEDHARPFEDTPDYLRRFYGTQAQVDSCRYTAWKVAQSSQIDCFLDSLEQQGLAENLLTHDCSSCQQYLDVTAIESVASVQIFSWFRNMEFKRYLESIQSILIGPSRRKEALLTPSRSLTSIIYPKGHTSPSISY